MSITKAKLRRMDVDDLLGLLREDLHTVAMIGAGEDMCLDYIAELGRRLDLVQDVRSGMEGRCIANENRIERWYDRLADVTEGEE